MTGLRRMRLCTASTERSHGVEKKGSYRPVQKTHRKHLPGRTWRQVGHDDTGKVRGSGSRSGTGDRQSSHLIDTSIGKVDVRNCNIVGEKNSQTATRAASPSSPYFDLSGEDQATFHGEIYPRRYGSTHVSDLVRHHVIRLQQLLPGVNVTRAVRTEPRLLNAPIPHLIRQLIKLRDGLPDANILSMINSLPRILLDDEISSRIEITVDKLRVLCPTKDMCSADVDGLLEENPELLYRLEPYDADFNALPMDLQNLLVIAGGGGGESYASWRNNDATWYNVSSDSGHPEEDGSFNECM